MRESRTQDKNQLAADSVQNKTTSSYDKNLVDSVSRPQSHAQDIPDNLNDVTKSPDEEAFDRVWFVDDDLNKKYGISPQSIGWAGYHFLATPGAKIAVADCGAGEKAYEFAKLNPRQNIIGLDNDAAQIKTAIKNHEASNLDFQSYDDFYASEETNILDGVLNPFNLHYLYSISGYSKARVARYLEKQLDSIKQGGSIVIQGYISPDNDENHHVLMELSDYRSNSHSIERLSEAELLIRFSQTARPLDKSGCKGFFLEELKPRIEHTRLFRLPMKWAQEFLLRKDDRKAWDNEINMEYTPYTFASLQNEINRLGARLAFYAPYWDREILEKQYEPRARLFNENGALIDYPPTSYIAVIQKIATPNSVFIRERRASSEKPHYLKIDHVKDESSGRLYDLVSRPKKIIDIIPYHYDKDGRINIYMRDNFARPIVNTVPRKGFGLDGKFWSGHLIEPITYEIGLEEELTPETEGLATTIKQATGLSLKKGGKVFQGHDYYQSPLMIDEKVETLFVEVKTPKNNQFKITSFEGGFEKENTIKALDAQSLLHAANVGLVADGKTEIALYYLMSTLGITPETWAGDIMPVGSYSPERVAKVDDLIKDLKSGKKSYKQTMRSGGTLSVHRSLFVEEGFRDGETTGLKTKSMEFAVPEDETINVAVVLPLTRDKSGEILAGFQIVDYPVPARFEGQSAQMDGPAFILPRDVKTMFDAKKYIAKQFGVKPDRVGTLGSSYFCDTGVTPQRIYPFVIASPTKPLKFLTDMIYAPIKQIGKITFKYCKPKNYLSLTCEALHSLGTFHSLSVSPDREAVLKGSKYKPKLSSRDAPPPPQSVKKPR